MNYFFKTFVLLIEGVLIELESGHVEANTKDENIKTKNVFLVIHEDNTNEEIDYWKVVLPDDVEIKTVFIRKLHCILISAHPRVNRMAAKVRKHFYGEEL